MKLPRIERAMNAMLEDGAIWVIHPKEREGVADTSIFKKAKALDLTYTKVARVSDTHTAEKLVRPRASECLRGAEAERATARQPAVSRADRRAYPLTPYFRS